MNMAPDNLIVISAARIKVDPDRWNALRNCPHLKVFDTNIKYPKSLVTACYKEMLEFCAEHHIDAAYYTDVSITSDDIQWRVDFSDPANHDIGITIGNIYFDSRKRRLLQWEIWMY